VGIAFVSLGEGIDCTTPAGKLQLLCAVDRHVALAVRSAPTAADL
jgi:hypothetical protein